jgi:hypothetical protein
MAGAQGNATYLAHIMIDTILYRSMIIKFCVLGEIVMGLWAAKCCGRVASLDAFRTAQLFKAVLYGGNQLRGREVSEWLDPRIRRQGAK